MTVKHTTNLDQFTLHRMNRRVNKSHVKKLAASIKSIGLKTPIVVTKSNVIIDGQHRYHAVKLLLEAGENVKLPYIQKQLTYSDIAEINSNQLRWTNKDWIEYHAKNGNGNYEALLLCQKAYPAIKLSALAPLLHNGTNLSTQKLIKGEFVYIMDDTRKYICEQVTSMVKERPEFGMKSFLLAVTWLMRSPEFMSKRLFTKLSANLHSVRHQSGTGNWAQHLLYWYNKGLSAKKKLRIDDLPRHH